jgi:pyrroloquinoline-quinone synthase
MSNNLLETIDCEIERQSLLKHRFYQMWSEGKLTLDHLQGYSKEYFQLVKAVPTFVENISCSIFSTHSDLATKVLVDQNFKEECEHIEPWIRFANAMGISKKELINYIATDKTNDAICDLTRLTKLSIEEAAAAMYAYEMELPKISRSKIDGLKKHYGTDNNNNSNNNTDATNYFEIHEKADIRHAAIWRNIIQKTAAEKEELTFNAVVLSLQAQNKLLDSVYEKYVRM